MAAPDPDRRPGSRTSLLTGPFVITTGAAMLYFTALSMLTPALPHYIEDVLGGGSVAVGVVVGAYGITAALLRPVVGAIGDRHGRRILVIGGALAVAVSLVGYANAGSLVVLALCRLVTGVGEAAVFVGVATAAQDLAPDSRRAEAASFFSVAVYGGQGIGPLVSEALRTGPGFGAVWSVAIALCLAAALLGRGVPVGATRRVAGHVRRRLVHPAAIAPGSVLLLSLIGFGGFSAFVSLHLDELGGGTAGPVFLVYSVIVLVVRVAGARLADERGPKPVAATGLVLITTGLVVLAAWPSVIAVYLGTVVMAPGVALQYPALMAICMDAVPAEERSSAVATMSLPFDLSISLGLPVLGVVAEVAGYRGAFAAGSVMALVALVVLWRTIPGAGSSASAEQPLAVGPEST